MNIVVNGEEMAIPEEVKNVEQLLVHFQLDKKPAIVERNQKILEKSFHSDEELQQGDRLEIVHFVGGG